MYFSAQADETIHCIGAATATDIRGPYSPAAEALACPADQGGAIDASGFRDSDGTYYVVYKIDGNSGGDGQPLRDTPIMLQMMQGDAVTPAPGGPSTLLHRTDADGQNIEAPSLTKQGDTYFLTFSSALYNTPQYDTSYATSDTVAGLYVRAPAQDAPLLVTGTESQVGNTQVPLAGPGGADFSEDGSKMLFHAFQNGHDISDGRSLWAANLRYDGVRLSIV